jgi:hypothetical protein
MCALLSNTLHNTASEAAAAAAALREANTARAAADTATAAALAEAHRAQAAAEAIAAATAASAAAECEQAAVTAARLAQEFADARHELAALQRSAVQHSAGKDDYRLLSLTHSYVLIPRIDNACTRS